MKILSPVGNFESLKMAVYNGADEVYLGVSDFNARNNIAGFSFDDLDEVVFFSHIHGVKVNLTVNILFSDQELENAVNLIISAHNKGVDCFIVQDLGLASIIHQKYPEIELHASTQMGICNLEGARQIEKLGFKRLVLARETPLEEIRNIKNNTSLELEYFVQGALCVCFSGNCYLSSYLCSASGNRGKCKQLCRLPYDLMKNGKVLKSGYLLSAKDFNMSKRLKDLESVGVNVLKIEGRARRPFYVGVATREYKNAVCGKKANQTNLKLAFNRDYTEGYFNGNSNIISQFGNHIGIAVGRVEKVQVGKKFNTVTFSSARELSSKSAIKLFENGKELSTISLYDLKQIGKNAYQTTTTQFAKVGAEVRLISDFDFENSVIQTKSLVPLDVNVRAFAGENVVVCTKLFGKTITFVADCFEKAKLQALSVEDVEKCFSKNEYFKVSVNFETNGVFAPKSALNQIRRDFFEKVYAFVLKNNSHALELVKIDFDFQPEIFSNFQIVENRTFALNEKNIIYSPEQYVEKDICDFYEICKNQGRKMFLDLPNFALDKDVEMFKNIVEKNKIPVVCNNYYALGFCTQKIAGGGLNVYNSQTAKVLNMPIICAEDSVCGRTDFAFMTLRHCPMKCNLGATCNACPYSNDYSYRMQNGTILKLKRKKLSTCTFYLTK